MEDIIRAKQREIEKQRREEEKLDIEGLIANAIENLEIIEI